MSSGGATIVGLKFDKGVVLAGERRATIGSFISSSSAKKVFLITDRLAIGTAGVLGDAQTIIKILREQLRYYEIEMKKKMSVKAAARLLSNVLYSYKLYPMMSEVLIGGIDDKPVLLVMDPIGSVLEDTYAAIGTGGYIAIGILEEGYKENMNEDEAKTLAYRAVRQAIRRDALSGGQIDIVVVSESGAHEETLKEQK